MAIAAAIEDEPENKKYKDEYYNTGETMKEMYGDDKNRDNPGEDGTRVDLDMRQLCNLSMEELNKRTDQAIEELDRGRAKDLVAEISRRALSPDLSVRSARADNLQLRNKITSLEQEVKSLREEIKKHANMGNKSGKGKETGNDMWQSQTSVTDGEEIRMDWTTTVDIGNKQSPTYKHELNKIIPEVTKRVVAAVDLTLARFVERLIPLEHSVTRLLETKVTEMERNNANDNYQEYGRRGKKRRTEETLSPVPCPPPPPQLNKEKQIVRSRIQSLSADVGIPEVGGKRNMIQYEERSVRSGNKNERTYGHRSDKN